MNILQIVLALLQATPDIIAAIKAVDSSIKGAKKGAVKKEIVMASFAHVPTPLQDAASALIDRTVGTLKAAGELPSHELPAEA
jgi:hypothetical protein